MTQLYDCRDTFENKLRELAAEDQRIVAVVNDSVGSSKLNQFGQMYPVRLVNVGIAEQNMIGVGAGLANGGLIPFVCGASPFLTGKAALLRDGGDVTLIANGVLVSQTLEAAQMLANEGVQARVLNMSTVRPLDNEAVRAAATETGGIVTAEEHTVFGGLGSAVAEVVVTTHPVPMRILGVPGVFAPTGSAAWLLEHFGLTAQGIFDAALELVKRKG